MGSHSNTQQNTNQQTSGQITETPNIPGRFMGQYNGAIGGLQGLTNSPVFSSSASPLTSSLMGTALGNIKGQNAAQQAGTARSLGIQGTGDNSALLGVLKRMGSLGAAGQANEAIPQALQAQTGMDLQGRQLQSGDYSSLLQAINAMSGQNRSVTQQQNGTNLLNSNSYTSKGFGG